ncbi:MAG: rhomboid family intramembrane serine protease [Desulfurococcaceae archaeon]
MVVVPGEVGLHRHKPILVILIILINVLVYIYTSYSNETPLISSTINSIYKLGFIPAMIFTNPLKTLTRIFTSMFTHADLLHIFFNMYFLWIFGSRIESVLGHKRFLVLYMLSGLSAILFHMGFISASDYSSLVIPAVGASGAISGVLGAYLLLFPHTRLVFCTYFLVLPYCFPISSSIFLLIWFAQQVIYGYMRLGGVAYFAHIGGFVLGLAITPVLAKHIVENYRYMGVFDWIYKYLGISIKKPKGLGGFAKAILLLLLIAIVAGFIYSSIIAISSPLSNTYALSISANNNEEVLMFSINRGDLSISSSQVDSVRIFVNRLPRNLIYSKEYAGKTIEDNLSYSVVIRGVRVPVELTISGKYDENGLLRSASGVMNTESVLVNIYGRTYTEPITINYEVEINAIDTQPLGASALMSAALSLLAISAIFKSDELVIVEESEAYSRRYPYI